MKRPIPLKNFDIITLLYTVDKLYLSFYDLSSPESFRLIRLTQENFPQKEHSAKCDRKTQNYFFLPFKYDIFRIENFLPVKRFLERKCAFIDATTWNDTRRTSTFWAKVFLQKCMPFFDMLRSSLYFSGIISSLYQSEAFWLLLLYLHWHRHFNIITIATHKQF